ncbi:MAG: SMC-Scp complex subunit ScpB [Alphaproteobacteria bacterium]|nr:SMC-Scp complex subunit ScpB [Alphaproteobacteria bacterium]|tara:strand:+ start:436 stop:1077 length:642 start_codon:yes stop_codon:yes gene_type:complete
MSVDQQHLRMVEALLFAAAEPLDNASIQARLPNDVDVPAALKMLEDAYRERGVNLVHVAGKWTLRTAPDLKFLLQKETQVTRRLSRAATETLAIIAYHQPVTRAEVEEIRGVGLSRGTLDLLLEIGWIRPKGRRRTPGRPVTYGTTEEFLEHFGFDAIEELPGLDELKASGMLQPRPPASLVEEVRSQAATGRDEDEEPVGDAEIAESPRPVE